MAGQIHDQAMARLFPESCHLYPMSAITAAELAELPRLTREQIAAPTVERGQRIRDLYLARPANYDYHKAFLVARILSSERLRSREKWCRFAKELMADPGVSNRLVDQAMHLIRLEKKEGMRLRWQ